MFRFTLAALVALAPFAVHPQPTKTLWLCSLSHDMLRLVCIADDALVSGAGPAAPTAAAAAIAAPANPPPNAVINGTAFPLDPRRRYVVDLWSVPTDPAFVEQLARATMCHRSPECSTLLVGERWTSLTTLREQPRLSLHAPPSAR